MNPFAERAPAKINLTLDVLGRRPDGYHNLRMLMQSVSLFDELTLTEHEKVDGLQVTSNLPYLPLDERNLAFAAACAFGRVTGLESALQRIQIHILKRIPVGAGLGGGSSDAAAVLRLLNRTYRTGLSPDALEDLAAEIGSDVPFCIRGGTQLAEGRGECLTPVSPLPDCHIILCKPPFSVSTRRVFSLLDTYKPYRPDHEGALAALSCGDLRALAQRLFNALEEVVPTGRHDIAAIRRTLLDAGALGAVMSGSGPTVFGLFSSEDGARPAYEQLRTLYPDTFFVQPLEILV